MFRSVKLPIGVPGQLYLHSTPWRYEPFFQAEAEVNRLAIGRIVCLSPLDEIREKSPEYAKSIEADTIPWTQEMCPMPDYDVPEDREALLKLARSVAERLQKGERVLIHCGAGIGRTGTLALCVLMVLGEAKSRAQDAVQRARAGPETQAQWDLVEWVFDQLDL